MKTYHHAVFIPVLGVLFWALAAHQTPLFAQGKALTYQGLLMNDGSAYTGNAEIQPTLWDAAIGGLQVADNIPATLSVSVTNGLLVLPLNFGDNFPGASRYLQLDVRTDLGVFTTLRPRQKITAAPYAITAGHVTGPLPADQLTGTMPSANLAGTYAEAVTLNNAANSFAGTGTGLTKLNASQLGSGTVPDGRLAANVARTNQVWLLGGNAGTTAGTHFVGTADNEPLEFKVNGQRAFRLEDNGDGSDSGTLPDGAPNVIGGSPLNFVATGVVGATIAGGGATNRGGSLALTNTIRSDYAAIGGGLGNRVEADATAATVGGGWGNAVGENSDSSVVGGGYGNQIAGDAPYATIAGGYANDVGADAARAVISGGNDNDIAVGAQAATIAGGRYNDIGADSTHSVVGGGEQNDIAANSTHAAIAGGRSNSIGTNSSYSAVGGGYYNAILGSTNATIGGGYLNVIDADCEYSSISGGRENLIGFSANEATIAGGRGNEIQSNARYAVICGGALNTVKDSEAFIGGGMLNAVGTNAGNAFIGGGTMNGVSASHGIICGGTMNRIRTNAVHATIGGGVMNEAEPNAEYAIIPGGRQNSATNFALAAGCRAKAIHTGSFVWTDSSEFDFSSTATNQFNIRATGGVRIVTGVDGAGAATAGVGLNASDSSWNVISDRAAKKNFQPVDVRQIVERLAHVPVQSWNYKWETDEAVPHLGPMAQDFKQAFYPGRDDKSISTLEFDGVALAAIQGLNQKLEEKNAALQEEVAELKALVQTLAAKVHGGGQ